jgi:hypothetical protein
MWHLTWSITSDCAIWCGGGRRLWRQEVNRFESHGLVDLCEKNVRLMVVGTCAKNVRLVLVALTWPFDSSSCKRNFFSIFWDSLIFYDFKISNSIKFKIYKGGWLNKIVFKSRFLGTAVEPPLKHLVSKTSVV